MVNSRRTGPNVTDDRTRCLFACDHIGAIRCYRALFKSWGWHVDVLTRNPQNIESGEIGPLPLFICSAFDGEISWAHRLWMRAKWNCYKRFLQRWRWRLGEKRYIAFLHGLYRLRLIDERWYLFILVCPGNMRLRAAGLSPEARKALAHPAVAYLMKSVDVVVTSFHRGNFIDLADALHQIYGVKVIAISAHRFNQFKQERASNEKLKSDTRRLAATAGCVKAVCDEYDWHYERHYLGIDAHRLWARPSHIRPERVKAMDSDVVLLTPIRKSALGSHLQAAYKKRYDRKALKPNYILEEMDRQPRFDTP